MDPTQFAQFELLARELYEPSNSMERKAAEETLLSFGTTMDSLPHYQFILSTSDAPYSLVLACSGLTKLVSNQWNSFTTEQSCEMRNYLLSFLASKGPDTTPIVIGAMVHLLCRITKMGWFDAEDHRQLVDEASKFLQASVDHCVIGLQILNELVREMNQPTPGRTLTQHRKAAVSFRDVSMFKIFQTSLTILQQLVTRQIAFRGNVQEDHMNIQAFDLALHCLSFDFLGTTLDESVEDQGTIQIPSSWRPLMEDSSTIRLFLDLYATSQPPRSSKALECLVQLASVRRSLFSNETERRKFLDQLMRGICDILRSKTGLQDQANYHEFCRLLARLKVNYNLTELVSTGGYREWLELVATFTVQSFQSWKWAANGIYYLLTLWSRLVVSMPYFKGDMPTYLDDYVPQLTKAYIASCMESVQTAPDDGDANPLEDEERVQEQLDALPSLCRFQYDEISSYILNLFDNVLQTYQDLLASAKAGGAVSHSLFRVASGQLTWLVYIVGSIISGRANASSSESLELMDGELASRVFRILQLADSQTVVALLGQNSVCARQLDLSLLHFFQQFRRVYIGDQTMTPSKIFSRLSERLGGLGDHLQVLTVIVNQIANNLRFWTKQTDIVDKTLRLFSDLTAGFSSGKMLLKLEPINYILTHHTSIHFPFLDYTDNGHHRTTFYVTLCRLLFAEERSEQFELFMEPFSEVCRGLIQIQTIEEFRQEAVKNVLIALFRDLRGIVTACSGRRTYGLFFDWIYPEFTPIMERAAQVWFDTPAVTTPLLKFAMEFVNNKSQRLTFDSSSPNGILLFREMSKLLVAYGSNILNMTVTEEAYEKKFKGIWVSLCILTRTMGGNFVNFGVFALYGDKALDDALHITLRMALSVPLAELQAFPKLSKAYYTLLEILFRCHVTTIVLLETNVFLQILSSIQDGFKSLDVAIMSQCASAIDHLVCFYFKNINKEAQPARALRQLTAQNPAMLPNILQILFNIILFEDCANQWSLSRPMLSLILTCEDHFNELKGKLISTQSSQDRRDRLATAFDRLMMDVQRNLETKNRDKFTQNLTLFRHDVKSFIT